jgi:hypothetical protein
MLVPARRSTTEPKNSDRSGLVAAPGRSPLLTSAASISRPSAARGNGSPASDRRSLPVSIRSWFTASYKAPWPRRRPGVSDKLARFRTGPSAQHRVRQLGQFIGPGGRAGMEIAAEPRQHGQWPGTGIRWQAIHHGLR